MGTMMNLRQADLARLLRLSPAGISHAVARGDLRIVAIQTAWRLMTDEMRLRWIEQLQAVGAENQSGPLD